MMCMLNSINGMMITLPDSSTLRDRLYRQDDNFLHLSDKNQHKVIDLLSNKQAPFHALIALINSARGYYMPHSSNSSFSLEQQKILATAMLEDKPNTLERVLDILNEREKKPTNISKSAPVSQSQQTATVATIQLPDAPTLKSRLCAKGLHDYFKALDPNISMVTNDTVRLEAFVEKLKPIFANYYKYLVIMQKTHTEDVLQKHNRTFMELLLQDYPHLTFNLIMKAAE